MDFVICPEGFEKSHPTVRMASDAVAPATFRPSIGACGKTYDLKLKKYGAQDTDNIDDPAKNIRRHETGHFVPESVREKQKSLLNANEWFSVAA